MQSKMALNKIKSSMFVFSPYPLGPQSYFNPMTTSIHVIWWFILCHGNCINLILYCGFNAFNAIFANFPCASLWNWIAIPSRTQCLVAFMQTTFWNFHSTTIANVYRLCHVQLSLRFILAEVGSVNSPYVDYIGFAYWLPLHLQFDRNEIPFLQISHDI